MSLKAIRQKSTDTSISTGTGAITLDENSGSGSLLASGAASGDQAQLAITDGAGGYEVSLCTLTFSAGIVSFTRDTVLASSNGGSKVSFAAGVKMVFSYIPDSLREILLEMNLPQRFFF